MTTSDEAMAARAAHYTALLETIDHQGTTKLHPKEREQLLEAADALLFGEPDGQALLRIRVSERRHREGPRRPRSDG